MQLAVDDQVFIVDMLHVCRCNSEGGGGDSSEGGTVGLDLTETEALLEEALGDVLRAPRVVKVGVGPKVWLCVCVCFCYFLEGMEHGNIPSPTPPVASKASIIRSLECQPPRRLQEYLWTPSLIGSMTNQNMENKLSPRHD